MYSERLLRLGTVLVGVLVAVLVTASNSSDPVLSLPAIWLDGFCDDARAGAAPYQPQHDRLRSRPRQWRPFRPRGDATGSRPRASLPRRRAPLSPLRPDLAHLCRRPRDRRVAR